MAWRVAVLGAEGGAEGVHVAEGQRHALAVELAGNGQAHGLGKEVLVKVHAAVRQARRVARIQCGDAEHLARTLAIAAGEDGGVYVDKAAVVEEAVDGLRRQRAHAEGALEEVGARPQMLYGAQVFQRVALFLQRIVAGALAKHGEGRGLEFKGLLHLRGGDDLALGFDGRAHADLFRHFVVVFQLVRLEDDLQVLKIAAVVELHEGKRLRFAHGAHPARHLYARARFDGRGGKQLPYQRGHMGIPFPTNHYLLYPRGGETSIIQRCRRCRQTVRAIFAVAGFLSALAVNPSGRCSPGRIRRSSAR